MRLRWLVAAGAVLSGVFIRGSASEVEEDFDGWEDDEKVVREDDEQVVEPEVKPEPEDKGRRRGAKTEPKHARKYVTGPDAWGLADPVEIYYAEFLLASWVLEKAPWNAYHSGLAFVNNRTGQKALFDYTPDDTSSVMQMVMPQVDIESHWRGFLLGDAKFRFLDKAHTEFFDHWPDNYNNHVKVGDINGSIFHKYVDWVEHVFAPKFTAFQPLEVVSYRGDNVSRKTPEGTVTVVRSRMCHDFVTDSLWQMYRDGGTLKAADTIFRDHILMYARKVEQQTEYATSPAGIRSRLRYMALLWLFLDQIKEQFTHARSALVVGWRLGLPVFLHAEDEEQIIELQPPFLNYCYLPLAIPPEVHDPFAAMKLCALGTTANLTNSSAPWPHGEALSIVHHLDRPPVIPAFILVVLSALFIGRRISSESDGEDSEEPVAAQIAFQKQGMLERTRSAMFVPTDGSPKSK